MEKKRSYEEIYNGWTGKNVYPLIDFGEDVGGERFEEASDDYYVKMYNQEKE